MVVSVFVVLGMDGVSGSLDDSVKPVFVVGGVVDFAGRPVGFFQRVETFDVVAFSLFVLAFDVAGVGVVDVIFKSVVSGSLERYQKHVRSKSVRVKFEKLLNN